MPSYCFNQVNEISIKGFLIAQIKEQFLLSGMTSSAFAAHLGLTAPRFSNLVNSQFEKFSVEMLIDVLVKTGYKVKLEATKEA